MTATTTKTQAFDLAIAAALKQAAQEGNFGILHAANRRGFQAATLVLTDLFKSAARQNDTRVLKALAAAHYPGALVALNHAERIQGLSQTPAPGQHINDIMARGGALQDADKAFETLARRHFIGERTGLERVGAAREFTEALAKRDQRRAEPVTPNATASWAI